MLSQWSRWGTLPSCGLKTDQSASLMLTPDAERTEQANATSISVVSLLCIGQGTHIGKSTLMAVFKFKKNKWKKILNHHGSVSYNISRCDVAPQWRPCTLCSTSDPIRSEELHKCVECFETFCENCWKWVVFISHFWHGHFFWASLFSQVTLFEKCPNRSQTRMQLGLLLQNNIHFFIFALFIWCRCFF